MEEPAVAGVRLTFRPDDPEHASFDPGEVRGGRHVGQSDEPFDDFDSAASPLGDVPGQHAVDQRDLAGDREDATARTRNSRRGVVDEPHPFTGDRSSVAKDRSAALVGVVAIGRVPLKERIDDGERISLVDPERPTLGCGTVVGEARLRNEE